MPKLGALRGCLTVRFLKESCEKIMSVAGRPGGQSLEVDCAPYTRFVGGTSRPYAAIS